MSTVQLAQIKTDEKTSASQSELRICQHRIPLPNRFPISPERNALKPAGVKDPLPGEIAVLARLAPPETVQKHEPSMIGFDLRGGFYYHALRGVEEFKKRKPEVWVHALQTPPKVRFGRGLLTCSEGMILPMFGIDSFSRWIVPPPPTPLTKEVINVFDRKGWGSMKKKDYEAIRNNNTNCDCAVCQGKDLEPFYEGKVLDVLAKAKVHDHLAQRKELEGARESIRKGRFLSLLNTKEYPREFLKQLPGRDGENRPSKD